MLDRAGSTRIADRASRIFSTPDPSPVVTGAVTMVQTGNADKLINVVFLGDAAVGKSALIQCVDPLT